MIGLHVSGVTLVMLYIHVEFHHVKLSISASQVAERSDIQAGRHVHKSPLFSHWFAIYLYEEFQKYISDFSASNVSVAGPLLDVVKVFNEIHRIRFEDAIHCGRGIMSDESHQLQKCELTASASYARALDRFLFKDANQHKGACFHQLPVSRKSSAMERPDLYIVQLERHRYEPILLGDVKSEDLEKASKETVAYCVKAMQLRHGVDDWPLLLGLAIAANQAKLFVVMEDNGFVRQIEVCSAMIARASEAYSFFSVLSDAVDYLCRNPLRRSTCGMVPFEGRITTVLDHHNDKDTHVFLCESENRVLKLYDTELKRSISPNVEAMESIRKDYLPNLVVSPLTHNGRVQLLQYDFINGRHKPVNIQQFASIMQDLHILHGAGYVHGDLRKENLVFSVEDNKGWMIDFDLAGKVDTYYPATYNHMNIEERHQHAKAGYPRQKKHDTYALSVIIKKYFGSSHIVQQLQEDDPNLLEIANRLKLP